MGRARIVDPDTERPPPIDGLPVLDGVVEPGAIGGRAAAGADGPAGAAGDDAPGGAARAAHEAIAELPLPFELRSRSRLRATLSDGREVAVILPRGTVLRGGALLRGAGLLVRVVATDEDVIEVKADGPTGLARAAYHLGNRHVPVQVRDDRLVFGYDPVLVDMLVRMGVRTRRIWAPFEPEAGAYGHEH